MEAKTNQELTYETTLELALLFEERTEDPCEHPEHDTEPQAHEGPGEWLVLRDHKGCSKTAQHVLVCDRFFHVLFSDTVLVRCVHCGELGIDIHETYTIIGRKGVDF